MQYVKMFVIVCVMVFFGMPACSEMPESGSESFQHYDYGGGSQSFKVPVPKGYNWEITQSWASHCKQCDEKYPDPNSSFCSSSHMGNCCKFGWDFNLPGNLDQGKPVLASADGTVENVTHGDGWGNTVIINHGGNVCTRYSHMKNNSVTVKKGDEACQGLMLGEIGDTGNSWGFHLHFQFEDCETHLPLERGFTDGNEIPMCTVGNDVLDDEGNYNFLILDNDIKYDCVGSDDGTPSLGNGWRTSSCGTFDGCPLGPNCGRNYGSGLKDLWEMDSRTRHAVEYLWSECAVDGKSDQKYHSSDNITRAEALKVPMYLYGLLSDCGESEPFADVNSDDWFYKVVACASEKNLIIPNQNFHPNDLITFVEAAKILVGSAVYAGVIGMQTPLVGSFPHIPMSHWGYSYVETLLYYGGIETSPLEYYPDQEVLRGEFAVMVAALSPCFCGNIVCEDGCTCSQENFACMNPDDNSQGTGGENGGGLSGSGIQVSCHIVSDHNKCEDQTTVLYIKCDLTNGTSESLRVNDLVMKPDGNIGDCQITDETDHSGVGVQEIPASTTATLNGHYEISCNTLPANIEVKFDLKERNAGVVSWKYDVASSSISTAGISACGQSSGGNDVPINPGGSGTCDPASGYTIYLNTNGVSIEIASSGSSYSTSSLNMLNIVPLHFQCVDLPAAILVHDGDQVLTVNVMDSLLPPFSVWKDWIGSLNISPESPPTTTTKNFALYEQHGEVLIRIPGSQ